MNMFHINYPKNSSISSFLSCYFGYPEQRDVTESRFNYTLNFLNSRMIDLSNLFFGPIIYKLKTYSNYNSSEINKRLNSQVEKGNQSYSTINTDLSFSGLHGFGESEKYGYNFSNLHEYRYSCGNFREEILKIVKLKKFRFFVLILNIPVTSIEHELMLILRHFMDHQPHNTNNNEIIPFNIISYKSIDSDLPYELLDSGDCLTNNHISMLDQISSLKIKRTLPHEIVFDFFDLNNNSFELKPSPASRNAIQSNYKMREEYPWLQTVSLSDIPGLVSFQVILSRNIERLYEKTTDTWGPFSYTLTQKEHTFNNREDIEFFQPNSSIFDNLKSFNDKFNLELLQKTYDKLFTTKQKEIQELINQIPDYESTKSYTSFLYKWREKSDESTEIRLKRLEIIWKRIDLFKNFLYHLPWVRAEISEPSLQVKFNLFSKEGI